MAIPKLLILAVTLLAVSACTAAVAKKPLTCAAEIADGTNQPGGIFLDGEAIRIRVSAKPEIENVSWTVSDYWGTTAGEGSATLNNGTALIDPDLKRRGYFLVHVVDKKDQHAEAFTSIAVIAPQPAAEGVRGTFGAMTHFAQGMDTAIVPLLKKAGIATVRDEHYWDHVEKQKGVYEFSDKSNSYMSILKENGIEPMIPMTFSNKLYDKGLTPYTPEGCDAYGRYGQAILKKYGEQIKALEIWNEYNGSWCKGPAESDRAKYYAQMLQHAYERIKEVRPDVKVLGCACVLIPLPFIEGIFKHDGLKYMDAVVIHPYRDTPEGVDEEVAELRELIRKYNDGQEKPIWVTETGRLNTAEYEWEKGKHLYEQGRRENASYLVRQYTLLLSQNVERIYWYVAADHMEFVSMGLLRGPKDAMGAHAAAPAYPAYATLIRALAGAKFEQRECMQPYTRTRVYRFARGHDEVRVCWAAQASKITIACKGPLTRMDLMGCEEQLAPVNGKLELKLDETPFFLSGTIDSIGEVSSGETTYADSVDDYSKVQGKNGWYYGYYDGRGEGKGDGADPKGPYTDDDFNEMEQVQTMWGYKWEGKKVAFLGLSASGGHPGVAEKRAVWAVRRWKSTIAKTVRVNGEFKRSSPNGDGIDGKILLDGKVVFECRVGGPQKPKMVPFDLELSIKENSLIDFAITPGPGLNLNDDATTMRARIGSAR